jgi:long-chain acyl-CoA synthetase
MDSRLGANFGYIARPAAERTPDKVAVIDLSGSARRDVTFSRLDERQDRIASLTRALGLTPGDRLFVCIGNRVEFLEIFFGAMRAGVVPVPGNPRLGRDALAYILADAACRAAVVDTDALPDAAAAVEAAGIKPRLALGPRTGWDDYETAIRATPADFTPPDLVPEHPCFMPYTSGSTGTPKGVVLTHAGQLWWLGCRHRNWPVPPEQISLVAVPLLHKNAMGAAIKPNLYAGATLVIMPRFEPREFLHRLVEFACTHSCGVPTMFILLLQEKNLLKCLDFGALKTLMIGSAPVHDELVREVERAFGARVIQGYGLTEGGPVMFGPPTDGRGTPVGSVGVPWPDGEVKLVDADGGINDRYGELWVKNPGVTPGFHNLPAVNRERFKDGFLRTGDLFSRDADGFYYFRGRVDDMFVCGGENIYPKEIENLLMRHEGVADVCVVPIAHATKGQAPAALVVRVRGAPLDEAVLKRFCLDHGPAYAHPREIVFADALPITSAGKVDRAAVKAEFAKRGPIAPRRDEG